jgi:hypothetical protein
MFMDGCKLLGDYPCNIQPYKLQNEDNIRQVQEAEHCGYHHMVEMIVEEVRILVVVPHHPQ